MYQVVHGLVDPAQVASRYGQVAGGRGPSGQDKGIEVAACADQLVDGDVLAHLGPAAERHPFGAKLG